MIRISHPNLSLLFNNLHVTFANIRKRKRWISVSGKECWNRCEWLRIIQFQTKSIRRSQKLHCQHVANRCLKKGLVNADCRFERDISFLIAVRRACLVFTFHSDIDIDRNKVSSLHLQYCSLNSFDTRFSSLLAYFSFQSRRLESTMILLSVTIHTQSFIASHCSAELDWLEF